MATASQTETGTDYADFDEYIDFQLNRTRSRIKKTEIMTAVVGVITMVLAYLLVFTILDHWVVPGGFGTGARVTMLGLLLAGAVAWVVHRVIMPSTRDITGLYAAKSIERADTKLQSALLNIVDLKRSGQAAPRSVVTAMEKQAAVRLSHVDVERAIDHRLLMRLSYALLAVVGLCCLYAVLSPKEFSLFRALTFSSQPVDTVTEIVKVVPGDIEITAGEDVEISADLRGRLPEHVTVFYSTDDRALVDEPLELRSSDDAKRQFRGMMIGHNGKGIVRDLTYYVAAGDARSDEYRITVIQPPKAAVDEVHYEFPSYTEFPPRTDPGGHLTALEGTLATITATANKPLRSARLVFMDEVGVQQNAEEHSMEAVDGTDRRVWRLSKLPLNFREDGSAPKHYRIECRSKDKLVDPEPTIYNVSILADQAPTVEFLDPTRDLNLPANAVVSIAYRAEDPDFKIRAVDLRLLRGDAEIGRPEKLFDEFADGGGRRQVSGQYELQLAPYRLQPGETVQLVLEARDNKSPSNIATAGPLNVTITKPVSPTEVQRQLDVDKRRQQETHEELRDNPDQPQSADQQDAGDGGESGEQASSDAGGGSTQSSDADGESSDNSGSSERNDEQPGGDGNRPDSESSQTSDERGGTDRPKNDGPADDSQALQKLIDRLQDGKGDQADEQSGGSEEREGQNEPGNSGRQSGGNEGNEPGEGGESGNRDPDETGNDDTPGEGADDTMPRDGATGDDSESESGTGETGDNSDTNPGGESGEKPGTGEGKPGEGPDSPTSSDNPGEGEGTRPAAGDANEKPKANPSGSADGPEREADPSENAAKRKADGTETGEATPNNDPDADPTLSKDPDNVKRTGDQPPATREGDPDQQPQGKVDEPRPGQDGAGRPGEQPKQQQSKTGKQGRPGNNNQRQAQPKKRDGRNDEGRNPKANPESQKHDQPGMNNPDANSDSGDPSATGSDSDGQSGGKPGESASDSGSGNAKPKGDKGQDGGKPGEKNQQQKQQNPDDNAPQDAAAEEEGQGGAEKGGGAQNQESDEGGDGEGGKGDKPGEGGGGGAGGNGGSSGSPGGGAGNGQEGGAGGASSGDGDTRGANALPPDQRADPGSNADPIDVEPNLEDARKAANLVLNELEDEMRRGKIDQKLLEELGWTEDQLREFSKRLRDKLSQTSDGESAVERVRRRQFEEMLKTLELGSKGRQRAGSSERDQTMQSAGPRKTRPPASYRALFEAYKNSRSSGRRSGNNR